MQTETTEVFGYRGAIEWGNKEAKTKSKQGKTKLHTHSEEYYYDDRDRIKEEGRRDTVEKN